MKIKEKHTSALPFFQRNLFPFFLLLFCFLAAPKGFGQCILNCNDFVNVSIQQNGFAVVTADMMLEHPADCPGPKEVDVLIGGLPMGDTVNCSHVDRVLMVRIRDITTGNFCTGSIRVQDKLGPLITCRDTIVPCGTSANPDSLGRPSIIDNCDPNPIAFYVDSIVDLTCTGGAFNAIIFRRWHARDNKNNLAVPCVQRISFRNPDLSDVVFPPSLDGISGPMVDCSVGNADPDVTGWPTIDSSIIQGFCKFNVTYEDARVDLCQNGFKVIRRWTVLNCCTNEDTSAFQVIKVMDTTPPTILCPDTLFVETNNDACASSFVLEPVPLSDDCSDSINISVQVAYPGGVLHGNGGIIFDLPLGSHEFIFTATDDCGNDTTCMTIVVVRDDDPPTPICTEYLVVNINSTGIACIPTASFDAGSTDNCCLDSIGVRRMDDPDTMFYSTVCFTCEDVGQSIMVVVRYWDCFGNFNDCMTEVRPQDKITPDISCPPDVTILCTDNPLDTALTGVATATDNCDSLAFSFRDEAMLNMCNVGMIFRTWSVQDLTGRKDSCVQKITVVDTTGFSITFPPDSMVDCNVNLDTLDAGLPQFVSDCENFAIGISDTVFDISCGKKLRRRFRVMEWCTGFDTTYVQEITVTDLSPPEWDQAPGSLDVFFDCADDETLSTEPTATDFCSDSVRIEFLGIDSIPGSCPNDYMKLYRYLAFDTCGNMSDTFVVKTTVLDTIPPAFTNVPPNIFLDCGTPIPSAFATATDNCGSLAIGVLPPMNLPGDCPAYVARTVQSWVALDACGNSDTISRTVFFIDTIPPTANPIADSTYECPDQVPPPDANVVTGEVDNCGGPVAVTFVSDNFNNNCVDTLFRVYRLTDTCGNFRDQMQRYFILDTIPPRITTCPGMLRDTISTGPMLCEGLIENLDAEAIDLCDTMVIVTNDSPFAFSNGTSANGIYPLGRHVFHFTATDDCGNQEQCTVDLTVVEVDPPLIECLPAIIPIEFDTTTGLAMVMPIDILNPVNTFDHCSPITIEITPNKFDCDSLANGAIKIVTVTVRDTFGNISTCMDTIMLIDPNDVCGSRQIARPFIAGQLKTPYNRVLKNTAVNMHCPDDDQMKMTNNYGLFIFDNMGAAGSAEIKPFKDDDPTNGVTTFDLVLMTRHILNTQKLNSPYKIIAADINQSGSISVADVLELRKMILGTRAHFSNNQSWRFVDQQYVFQNPANPLLENFPEKIVFDDLHAIFRTADFVAVKVGDLNGNAVVNLGDSELDDREKPAPYFFKTEEQIFKKGEKVTVPILMGDVQDLPEGFQFTLQFENGVLHFSKSVSAAAEGFSDQNLGLENAAKGQIPVSWNGPISDPTLPLFYLEFTALKDGKLSESLSLNSTLLRAESYHQALEIKPLMLEFFYPNILYEAQDFHLFQNTPNPFSGETQIEFLIKTATSGVLEVTDVSGNIVFQHSAQFQPGKQIIKFKSDSFGQPGVYFYRLTTPRGSQSRRMLLVR